MKIQILIITSLLLTGCMGIAPIDRSYEKRMLGSNITWVCVLPIIDTEQNAIDLELATTF